MWDCRDCHWYVMDLQSKPVSASCGSTQTPKEETEEYWDKSGTDKDEPCPGFKDWKR